MFKVCTKNMTMICWHHKKCPSFFKFCIAQMICDLMRTPAKKRTVIFRKYVFVYLFRILKKALPGPFTFILPASKEVPKILQSRKKTIGLRIPDNLIALSIIKTLGHPILSASFPGDEVEEYTEPEMIQENWGKQIDMVIDGGIGGINPSTVVDCTTDHYEIIRQGAGVWDY